MFFDCDKATLSDRARQIIKEAADNSAHVQYTRIEVNGYTDTSGTPKYNLDLSVRRARAVEAELVKNGVPESAITIQGFGDRPSWCRPVRVCASRRTAGSRSSSGDMLPLLQRANAPTTARAKVESAAASRGERRRRAGSRGAGINGYLYEFGVAIKVCTTRRITGARLACVLPHWRREPRHFEPGRRHRLARRIRFQVQRPIWRSAWPARAKPNVTDCDDRDRRRSVGSADTSRRFRRAAASPWLVDVRSDCL